MRGLFWRNGSFELDFSVHGAVPVKSSDSVAHRGMPDTDPTVEIGPSLNVHLYFEEQRQTNLDLRLPVRRVIAANLSRVEPQGWLFLPQLALSLRNVWQGSWNLGLVGVLLYADQPYHHYVYDVAPQYATAVRPAYDAAGGYPGAQITTTFSRRYDGLWIGGFLRWDDISGAAFADSSLVNTRQTFAAGIMVSWILFSSGKWVEVSND